jgi:hypothetical protein
MVLVAHAVLCGWGSSLPRPRACQAMNSPHRIGDPSSRSSRARADAGERLRRIASCLLRCMSWGLAPTRSASRPPGGIRYGAGHAVGGTGPIAEVGGPRVATRVRCRMRKFRLTGNIPLGVVSRPGLQRCACRSRPPLTAAASRGRDQRLDMRPFVISQVAAWWISIRQRAAFSVSSPPAARPLPLSEVGWLQS